MRDASPSPAASSEARPDVTTDAPPHPTGKPRYMTLIVLALLMTAAGWAATLAGLGARWHWVLDLTTHWVVPMALGMLLPLILLLALRRWKLAMLPLVVVVYQLFYILPLYIPPGMPAEHGPVIHALLANVHVANRDSTRLIELIETQSPDIIVLLETGPRWVESLEPLREKYPHQIVEPRTDSFGMMLMSRHPISHQLVTYRLGDAEVPSIIAHLNVTKESQTHRLCILATHPLPPMSATYTKLRNDQIKQAAELLKTPGENEAPSQSPLTLGSFSQSILLMGDLNTTSWSPSFKPLTKTKLRDTRRGFGVQATWPSDGWPMQIPIDHILASEDLVILDHHIGPDIGSDHLPVLLSFAVKK